MEHFQKLRSKYSIRHEEQHGRCPRVYQVRIFPTVARDGNGLQNDPGQNQEQRDHTNPQKQKHRHRGVDGRSALPLRFLRANQRFRPKHAQKNPHGHLHLKQGDNAGSVARVRQRRHLHCESILRHGQALQINGHVKE